MKVAVFGASGKTGSLVVDEALRRGYEVVAITRKALKQPAGASLETRIGDVSSSSFVADAISGCHKIVSCMGQTRKGPLSGSPSPPDILSSVTRAIVTAVGANSEKHFVYMSAFGVGEDLKKHSLIFRAILKLFSIGNAYKDHAEAEKIVKSAGVNWTIVRPVGLTDDNTDEAAVDLAGDWSSFDTISRRAVARFLVDCLEDGRAIGQTMTIGKRS